MEREEHRMSQISKGIENNRLSSFDNDNCVVAKEGKLVA